MRKERLKKIVIEASEQSGRGSVPEIEQIIGLKEALIELKEKNEDESIKTIVFHTDAELLQKSDLGSEVEPLAVFIGPEGGWSPDEIDLFNKNNIAVKSIGTQVLRAETAVIATLSLVMFGK